MRIIGSRNAVLPKIEGQDEGEQIKVIGYVQARYTDEADILCERLGHRSGTEYVVWRVNLYTMELHSGFYTMEKASALRMFAYRIGARPEHREV